LQLVGTDVIEVGLTVALVLEYESVLKRPGLVPISADDVDALIDYWCSVGNCRRVDYSLRPAAADPGDDLVLEAATATISTTIVSLNIRDMQVAAAEYGIELLTPGEFLRLVERETWTP